MVSPPKPWERGTTAGASSQSQPAATSSSSTPPISSISQSGPSSDNPPQRPPPLSGPPTTALTNPYNPLSTYSSPYSNYNSTFASGYNRFGSTYSPYGGGYGGGMYGGGLGGYGMNGMGYGMNGMYGGVGMPGMPGMPMDPNNPSLTQTLESTTQQTFALLHSIVQTFTGLSQMLESTFMATHSSFFAMVGVVDQFSHLRNALGSVLGVFGLVRWLKDFLTGKRQNNSMQNEFREFVNGRPVQGPPGPPPPKPSKKPLIIFLLAIFGVPYAMHKLIKILTARAQSAQALTGPNAPFDPSTLTFARAKYAFTAASPVELGLKENEIVAIMGKLDPNTGMEVDPRLDVDTDWWKGRTREGREGWFPSKWVEVLERKKPPVEGKPIS
ncbi:hypothetical protein BD410DRAFT_782542 [Rickenella mellea]|uniref:Peroxisomal membrane protein PEX13 n=1 Tax=Rickenella mellea TaxID=50990 RepID=A0A4Y7QKV9_9AGAM|nr:hypothetical protein BD410DRAFT_782542 [Rickenella mellea]